MSTPAASPVPPTLDTSPEGARAVTERLRDASAEQILEWAVGAAPGRVALSASFGAGGVVLIDILHQMGHRIPVIFLDTWMHFPETYAFRDAVVAKYNVDLVEAVPAQDPGPLYETDTDACCQIRKVEPMDRALVDVDVWISALRRDQGASRSGIELVESQETAGHSLLKVYPIATWNRSQLWRYIHDHKVPYHPMLDQGYKSIGCWPCTRAVGEGEGERAGRWSGTGKVECGLHIAHPAKKEG